MSTRDPKAKKRKISDSEESSGSDSENKNEDLASNSDDESDSESQDESVSEDSDTSVGTHSSASSNVRQIKRTSMPSALLSDSSESGDENSEKCAICLRSIVNQEVGNPEVCDHLFCSVCIIEWSKNSNVCPLDRQQFSIIFVRKNKDGDVVKKVPVEETEKTGLENNELEEMDDTVCEICGSGDREDILLLCDNCDRGFHTICLTPPLEDIPFDNEWYCPECEFILPDRGEASNSGGIQNFLQNVSSGFRSLRPRVQMIRTRLFERIRITVNRIVENYAFQDSESSNDDYLSEEYEESDNSIESDVEVSPGQPSTSGLQTSSGSNDGIVDSKTKRKTTAKPRKRTTAKRKTKTGVKRRRRTTTTTTTTTKRKTKSGTVKRKTKKRKTRVRATRSKKVKIENEDGTITEKIVKTRTYKRRRQKRRKKKVKPTASSRRRLRVKSITTPKTVKGRLALMLGMVAPKKPGQFLPDVKAKKNSSLSSMDLNRARAGIPKLHIFGRKDELQYYSSESDNDDIIADGSGGVATVAQQRTSFSRLRDRKKAAMVLQSTPASRLPKSKPVTEPPASEYVDILGSILDSQAIWHSKDTKRNVKVNPDGSIEVIKNKETDVPSSESNRAVDVREGTSDAMTTQAPMYPGSGNRQGGFRQNNRNSYGDARSGQDNMFSARSGQNSAGVSFNRFGGPPGNDREGYTNYLNNMPQGPTPFCRGGPPLRFRMPPRQQLRRIPFPPRNRPAWQPESAEEQNENNGSNDATEEVDNGTQTKSQEEEDIDLYSDIETGADKTDNSGPEDSSANYPALGPPPEPSAFLLGLDENGEFGVTERKDKSEVYDPAEPCDSEDEMVIDENTKTPEKKETECEPEKEAESKPADTPPVTAESKPSEPSEEKACSEEEEEEEDCPIFSIYSSATREFSQKEEEERKREIEEDKRKIEGLKLHEESKTTVDEELKEPSETDTKITDDKANDEQDETVKESENNETKELAQKECSNSQDGASEKEGSSRRSPSPDKDGAECPVEADADEKSAEVREGSSTPELDSKISKKSKDDNSESDDESSNLNESTKRLKDTTLEDGDDENKEGDVLDVDKESDNETASQKVATGLEGLDVEQVSSDNDEADEFADRRSLSSLSLSDLSHQSRKSMSPMRVKKKRKSKKKKTSGRTKSGKAIEEGEIDDSEKDRLNESFTSKNEEVENENSPKSGEKRRVRKSGSNSSDRQILGSKENKKSTKEKIKENDLSWKKPSKKDKNYREGKKRSRERGGRSKSKEKKRSRSPSPKKDKKKNKDRKKKVEKKKDIERYDVRKIVKNKKIRKTDAFGRDILSKSRSISRSRTRSPIRDRSRNMLRRDSRSFSRSRSRSFRRGRSPVRRRYQRSRTRSRSRSRSRSKSIRRSYSRSRSPSRGRKTKKKIKSKGRLKVRSRSRGRLSRSPSRGRRRSLSRSRSRSPGARVIRGKKGTRSRKSWSHQLSRTPSFSPRRSRSMTRSPIRVRRSYTRSVSTSWSRGRSPLPRTSSLEKLTIVLTTKDKKKRKKIKEGKKVRRDEKRRKKTGNSKEVFASGDNVLVSVNFRNNNNVAGNTGAAIMSTDGRNTRLNSMSPVPGVEASRKKKRGSDYETERLAKKSKKSNPISKKAVDVALSNSCQKRAKKLTRLSEKDAEVILNRKPVAVIDLDMSPYREQTPSPVNVVVVSDSGSGDEGKDHSPQRAVPRGTPGREIEKMQETVATECVTVSAPSSPVENGYVPTSGPKTPPEPQIKFSINKPQQLRQIANPLGDDDDDEEEDDETGANDDGGRDQRVESLDRRIEKELDQRNDVGHKGPNTPPAPRGPSTPKTLPSPSSPDVYDPFEPTKSRSPSPSQADKENRPSPKLDGKDDQVHAAGPVEALSSGLASESLDHAKDPTLDKLDDKVDGSDKGDALSAVDCSSSVVTGVPAVGSLGQDGAQVESPERKITVLISTPQSKVQTPAAAKAYVPVLKQIPMASAPAIVPPASANLTASTDLFSGTSPTKTSRSNTGTSQSMPVTGIQRLQHRLGSPVNRTANAVKSTPEKRPTTRTDPKELFSSGNYMIRNVSKRNGEPAKQPRPLQDATNETIDITMDMDDSPYSPASSEGDDLFDPPVESSKPSQSNSKPAPTSYKGVPKSVPRKSPGKQLSKFDLLFGISGPTLSPVKVGNKKMNAKVGGKPQTPAKVLPMKQQKKGTTKKNTMHKMDEDQLRILDDLPSSAVELQVKDKFLKKLNRQERVVDEVKTVLKPHYAKKHITKEEYKDILRRSVPKICHSRSGEINPSKIQSLIEAYVRKFRHAKKKGINTAAKPRVKKTMFS